MKVFMTADTVGGVWTYSLQLSQALQAHGIAVDLATMGAPLTARQHEEASRIPSLTVYESAYKLEWMDDPWADVATAGDWLLDLERQTQPDIVHLNSNVHGALPWNAPVLMVGHSCVLSWWVAVRGEPAPASFSRYRSEVRRGLQAADLVVAPSGAMLASLQGHYGPLPNSRVIYNGQDAILFASGRKEPFVLSAGRLWDEGKNVSALQELAPGLEWPVYVAGEERHPDGGERKMGGVQPLGRLSQGELARWFSRASIYALPARYEPFGLSVLEAGLAGCALVLGDISSLREIWGDAALFVPPSSSRALQAAIESLIADEGSRQEWAERAHRRAVQFTTERMAEQYIGAYRGLVQVKKPVMVGRS